MSSEMNYYYELEMEPLYREFYIMNKMFLGISAAHQNENKMV